MAAVIREDSSGLGLEVEMEPQAPSHSSASASAPETNRGDGQEGTNDDHSVQRSVASEYDNSFDNEKSIPSSYSHQDSEPGFAQVDGEIDGHGYNETTVDIVAVPCIGASPVDTWARDPLSEGYFKFPPPTELQKYSTVKELPGSSVLSPTINRNLPKASHMWIRQGIRKEVSMARVMLYKHRELAEGLTLDQAADDLLDQLIKMRESKTRKARPIFFICHSIGGLVAKLALVKACQNEELKPLMFNCHGIAFFGKTFNYVCF